MNTRSKNEAAFDFQFADGPLGTPADNPSDSECGFQDRI